MHDVYDMLPRHPPLHSNQVYDFAAYAVLDTAFISSLPVALVRHLPSLLSCRLAAVSPRSHETVRRMQPEAPAQTHGSSLARYCLNTAHATSRPYPGCEWGRGGPCDLRRLRV